MFRINAIFIHSTTNGYRHLIKSGRAACRPIEGEETLHTGEAHHIKSHITCRETFNVIYLIQCPPCNLQYIGETKRRLKDRFNEHRRPILNLTGNYIHIAVSEHFLTSNHSDNHILLIPIEKLNMGVILSGKHVKPTLSIKLRQLSLWASINVTNCNYI